MCSGSKAGSNLVLADGALGDAGVVVEVVVVEHVGLDALQVDHDVVELLQQEEAHRHALQGYRAH